MLQNACVFNKALESMVILAERIRMHSIRNTVHEKCISVDPTKFKAGGMGGGVVKYAFTAIFKITCIYVCICILLHICVYMYTIIHNSILVYILFC